MPVAEGYIKAQYKSPEILKNSQKGRSVLIIGTGQSTSELLKHRNNLKERFDLIIGLNFAIKDFEPYMDWHFIIEKNPIKIVEEMCAKGYRNNLPRVLNWKAIPLFPKDLEIYKATRNGYGGNYDIFNYKNKGEEGFISGPQDSKGLAVGSVMMQALHFSAILGCAKIYLSGADLLFKNNFDHYYNDSSYRKSTTKIKNRSPIVKVKISDQEYQTTEYFRESAKFIDTMIETCFKPHIQVFDFSNGLLQSPKNLKFDEFFK